MKNKIYRKKLFYLFAGAGILEVLLALGLMASVAPFVFRMITKQTNVVRNIALTKELDNLIYAFQNYLDATSIDLNDGVGKENTNYSTDIRQVFAGDTQIKGLLEPYGLNERIAAIWTLFEKQEIITVKDGESFNGYIVLSILDLKNTNLDILTLREIAALIGPNAATIDDSEIQGATTNWEISLETITPDPVLLGLVVRLSKNTSKTDIYLNRILKEKAVMNTTLFMNKHQMVDIGAADAKIISGEKFYITDKTKFNKLTMNKFDLNGILEGSQEETLSIDTYMLEVGEKLKIRNLNATRNLLKSSDVSLLGNIETSRLISPSKITTNELTFTNSYILNNNVIVTAKEIRADKFKWNSTVNSDTIITEKIDKDGVTVVDSSGVMHLTDLELSDMGRMSTEIDNIRSLVDALQARWDCITSIIGTDGGGDASSCP